MAPLPLLSFQSLPDLRVSLQLIVGPLHSNATEQQLALLWDYFIAPRLLHDRVDSKCAGCIRNPLPLGLQNQAVRAACVLLERLIGMTNVPTDVDSKETSANARVSELFALIFRCH